MSIQVKQNFSWADTDKKLVIFMPNYNGKRLTEASIRRIQTAVEHQHWMIIIGNDNVDDNWDHLRTQNVASITILRDDKRPRNGAFIRNYVIKRCQSRLFLQKDGEVCIEGDFIYGALEYCFGLSDRGWRPGHAVALTEANTNIYATGGIVEHLELMSHLVEPVVPCTDLEMVKRYLIQQNGRVNFISYYHYAYCVPLHRLRALNGYDEDYKFYGWEDVDMYLRLASLGVQIQPDYNCYAIHLSHPSTVNRQMLNVMCDLFKSKDPRKFERNPNGWGEGE